MPPRPELVPRFEEQGYSAEAVERRRRWIEEKTGADLRHVGSYSFPSEEMRGNIENPIGVAQVPIGVAGPLLVQGAHARGVFYVPMATTEGTLVRSYERGSVVLTRAGGVTAHVYLDENQIAPVFPFEDVAEAATFVREVESRFEEVRAEAESTTRHGRLLRVECYPIGRHVMLQFRYSTGDAHGMNMIAKATERACEWLLAHTNARRYNLFGGLDSEKHASAALFAGGKGKKVVAGARLSKRLVRSYLNTTAEGIVEVRQLNILGQFHSGTLGCNAHLANGLAALLIACGQDVANLANAAVGITNLEMIEDGDLYASVTLPSLTLATVGGGTGLGTGRECLEMLGCAGNGGAPRLAEITAAFLLAGEISLCAAIASGEFVASHEAYGRNRPAKKDALP
ncbi:MAG TPA: hydroxymethylglutaryl-CoA reductase [Thermoanaerobaculia bacterium]|nr:hydroxymethylglutaryl-CoA reductase [Thermoanaerobaculia bacterium]